tara:strand:+ start:109 stop:654 length:546 start_codon:yes stop_codon:yes gene_type:complete
MKKEIKKDNNICQVQINIGPNQLTFARGNGDFTQAGLELAELVIHTLANKGIENINHKYIDYEPCEIMRSLLYPTQLTEDNFILFNNSMWGFREPNYIYEISFYSTGKISFHAQSKNESFELHTEIDTQFIDKIAAKRGGYGTIQTKHDILIYLNKIFAPLYELALEDIRESIEDDIKAAS